MSAPVQPLLTPLLFIRVTMANLAFLLAAQDGHHRCVLLPDTNESVTPLVAEEWLPAIQKPYGYINVARYMHDFITGDGQAYTVLYEPRNLVTEPNTTVSNIYGKGEELWRWYGNVVVVALEAGKAQSVQPAFWPKVENTLRE